MSRVASLPFVLAGLMLASPAFASDPVVVAPTLTEGELDAALRDRLEARLIDTIGKSDLVVLERTPELEQQASACTDARCRAELLSTHEARFLLVPEIALVDEDYHLGLTLYGQAGGKIARLEEVCGLCGMAEAADLLADLGARISRKAAIAAQASSITVDSDPSGASIYLGDELVGTTPVELPLEPGAYGLRIELDGFIGLERNIEVVAGESNTVELELQPVPVVEAEADGADRRPKLLSGLGWGSLVLGLGAAAGGATLIALDQKPITSDCSGSNIDAQGNCRWRHATLEPGIGLVAGGVALVGVGVALLVISRKRAKQGDAEPTAFRLRPSPGGIALQF